MSSAEDRQVLTLAALAQATRLRIVSTVAEAGTAGIAAGEIARALHCPASTLSFHLKELSRAEVLEAHSRGRFVIYALRPAVLDELAQFVKDIGGARATEGRRRPARGKRTARKSRTVDRDQLSMFGD
jgi:DNA-binding transcriptional ArsR family regulator